MNKHLELSLSHHELQKSIGKSLIEIKRWFVLSLETFLEDDRFTIDDFIPYNSGLTSFQFEEYIYHTFDTNDEQLSLELIDGQVMTDEFVKEYAISKYKHTPKWLLEFLGKTCIDVRIWKCREALAGNEIGDAGISYLFEDQSEIFYCIYLHDSLDSDFLVERKNLDPTEIMYGYSLLKSKIIDF